MSWKSIELQVALPRTQEAGKHQDQLNKQNQRFQESLAQSQLRQQELQKKKVNKFDYIRKKNITKEEKHSHDFNGDREQEEKSIVQGEESNVEHPFLGTKIDFSR